MNTNTQGRSWLLKKPIGVHPKYAIRLFGVPRLARLAHAVGVPWSRLGEKLGPESLIAQVATLPKASETPSDRPLDIVFVTMLGGYSFIASTEIALGVALRARGHRVRYVVCDQALPVCEVKRAGSEAEWSRNCGKCWAFARSYLAAAGVEVIPVSSLVNPDSLENPEDWLHILDASLLKHFRVGVLDDSEKTRERRATFLRSVSISAQVGRAVVEMRPDRVVMTHGIYSTWGPAREIVNKAGIPLVTYDKGKRRQSANFNWRESSDWWGVEAEWERVKDLPLSKSEHQQINAYLDSRRDHSKDALVYNFGAQEDAIETRRRFQLDPAKPTFTLFTNVLWDAASAQREIVFRNPVEWTLETIRWFAAHPDRQLIVKVHPAEVVIGTKQPFASIVKENFPTLPDNVRLIEPSEKVNSWSILGVTDLGLVHTSTVGMELPLSGVPVACVSRTHYRGRGFTIDVQSREEYFQLLGSFQKGGVNMDKARELALRYAFLLFERYQIPWTLFHEPRHADVRAFRFRDSAELLRDPGVAIVVRAIETQADFLVPRAGAA